MRRFLLATVAIFITYIGLSEEPTNQKEFTSNIENEQLYCVQKWEKHKIYLNPENIQISNHGIHLDLNGTDSIPLSALYSDSAGCFILKYEADRWCRLCQVYHEPPPCIPSRKERY